MQVPASELPDMRKIAEWARENLPAQYQLTDVRWVYGSDWPEIMPLDFEVRIEYVDLDPQIAGSTEAIRTHQLWAKPLEAKIRTEWPAHTVRIAFVSRDGPRRSSNSFLNVGLGKAHDCCDLRLLPLVFVTSGLQPF